MWSFFCLDNWLMHQNEPVCLLSCSPRSASWAGFKVIWSRCITENLICSLGTDYQNISAISGLLNPFVKDINKGEGRNSVKKKKHEQAADVQALFVESDGLNHCNTACPSTFDCEYVLEWLSVCVKLSVTDRHEHMSLIYTCLQCRLLHLLHLLTL